MPRTRTTLFATLPLLVVALAGCSAVDAPEVKSDSQIAADARAWDVKNATCLRDAGIDVGDPAGDGTGAAISLGGDVDMDTVAQASEHCRKATTDELGDRPVTESQKKSQQEFEAKILESNACLRKKGYDAPDPSREPGGALGIGDGLADVPEDVLDECGALGGTATTVTP